MGRPPAQLSPNSFCEVLGYLKAAALRDPGLFQPAAQAPETRLLAFAKEVAAGPDDFRHLALGEWIVKHVTPEGRARMFATLRRRRADAKGKPKAGSMRLAPADVRALQALTQMLDMPPALVIRALLTIASADEALRSQMVRLRADMETGTSDARQRG
jgi:hypothetical protein